MGLLIPENERTQEVFLNKLLQAVRSGLPEAPDVLAQASIAANKSLFAEEGGLLHTLLSLYAHMLADTAARLNQLPEKHRYAFLNLQQAQHRAATPAEAIAVFEVVEGYDKPVTIPKGTLIAAQSQESPILFRTKRELHAIPSKLLDIIWADRETDVVEPVHTPAAPKICKPFYLWNQIPCMSEQHIVDFYFQSIFTGSGGKHEVYLLADLELAGKPLQSSMLTDPASFCWSLHAMPHSEDEPPVCTQVSAKMLQNGAVCLSYSGFVCKKSTVAWLRLELLNPALAELIIRSFSLYSTQEDILPEAVVSGERKLASASFYPFENPMQSLGECFIFCSDALLRPGAEITMRFDLALVQTLVESPPTPELIDYKWVMKRPPPPPAPTVYEAFAQSVRLEYWNGSCYCKACAKYGKELNFTAEETEIRLRFDCFEDIACGEGGGYTGYFLRLSSEFCDALYQIPRRVYTPRIENLTFSYCYLNAVLPQKISATNYRERKDLPLATPFQPFYRLPYEQALFLGFDSLPPGTRIQIFFDVELHPEESESFLSVEIFGAHGQKLQQDDGTFGFTRSGILSILLPAHLSQAMLFGISRYWLCILPPHRQSTRSIKGIYLNGQWAENRVRHVAYFSFSALQLNGAVGLPHGNIAKANVRVRSQNKTEWALWNEYTLPDGSFCNGFYTLDYHSGTVTFPKQISALAAQLPHEDFIEITYDICDGEQGNVGVAAINKMHEELPFISSVFNPLAVVNGEDSEPDALLANRLEHSLYHNGRAVTIRDFELIAKDLYPQIYDVKCVAGQPVQLALLLKNENNRASLPLIKMRLLQQFTRVGCFAAAGTQVKIFEAIPVPLHISAKLYSKKHVLSTTIEQLSNALVDFLNPVSGGLRGLGWKIGGMPTYEQIEAYLTTKTPEMVLAQLEIRADGGGLFGDYAKNQPGEFHVPGKVDVELEVSKC